MYSKLLHTRTKMCNLREMLIVVNSGYFGYVAISIMNKHVFCCLSIYSVVMYIHNFLYNNYNPV